MTAMGLAVMGHPRDTFHHNPPFSTIVCHNPPQSTAICGNLSAICLQYVCNICNVCNLCQAHKTPPISIAKITLPKSVCAQHRIYTVLILCLFTKQPSQQYKPFLSVFYFLS